MTDDTRLAEIEARVNAATRGPWVEETTAEGERFIRIPNGHDLYAGDMEGTCRECFGNTAFIAPSRDDVPWLLSRVRALEAQAALDAKVDSVTREAVATWEREGYGNTDLRYSMGGMKFSDVLKIRAALAARESAGKKGE
jgi:hypothetical protein